MAEAWICSELNGAPRSEAANSVKVDFDASLLNALRITIDSLALGVIIVTGNTRILHANRVAKTMLDARSPIVSLGGFLVASQANLTDELRQAISAKPPVERSGDIPHTGVPLVNKDATAAVAHVVPLVCRERPDDSIAQAAAAVIVTSASPSLAIDATIIRRIFGLTPAENRMLKHLLTGVRLTEAAAALGVTEATAKTHRRHILSKAGVLRWSELMLLIGQLIPPVCRFPSY